MLLLLEVLGPAAGNWVMSGSEIGVCVPSARVCVRVSKTCDRSTEEPSLKDFSLALRRWRRVGSSVELRKGSLRNQDLDSFPKRSRDPEEEDIFGPD